MAYFNIFEYQGFREVAILASALGWGLITLSLTLKTLRQNHKYHKDARTLHLDISVDLLSKILVIPYLVK